MPDQPTATRFDSSGSESGSFNLNAEIFGVEPNLPVMHQVVTAQLAAARSGSANTKTRAEVRGGGRKPWRQKGLGRARHGSIRSPMWVGGGVAHGPKPRSYAQATPKKMKKLALHSALSTRASEGAVKIADLDWTEPKTKTAREFLTAAGIFGRVLVIVDSTESPVAKSFRNLPTAALLEPSQLNTYDILKAETVIFTPDAVAAVGAETNRFDVTPDDFVKEEEE